MPRVRVRIHPTGHLEVQVEGLADDRCHALVAEVDRVRVDGDDRPIGRDSIPFGTVHPQRGSLPIRADARSIRRAEGLVSTVAPPGAGGSGRRCTITPTRAAASSVRALRASVVEWDECGQAWTAHILASGTMLGPFTTRAEAVSAERAILATRLDAALDHHAGPPSATSRSSGHF
jgi:hypothetical protein